MAWSSAASLGLAQSPGGADAIQTPAIAVPKFDAADNAWVLVSAALVLFMTAPALALFYGGLLRKKNVLSVLMQCVCLMCLMTVLWALYGYSLVFGNGMWIGDGRYLLMNGVNAVWTDHGSEVPLYPGLSIPVMTHMLFQGMFFIITPALICGAFAERMKFSAMVVFMILWGTLVYCPLAHWIWGGGILAYGSKSAMLGGALDFAGGTVVHISSGVSALICALLLGKRLGHGDEPMPPHNMTYAALGAAMLWVGWFGFNAGSALAASRLATCAFAATHFAAGAGGLTWAALEWKYRGKPSLLGIRSGLVAGLATITQAAGYVTFDLGMPQSLQPPRPARGDALGPQPLEVDAGPGHRGFVEFHDTAVPETSGRERREETHPAVQVVERVAPNVPGLDEFAEGLPRPGRADLIEPAGPAAGHGRHADGRWRPSRGASHRAPDASRPGGWRSRRSIRKFPRMPARSVAITLLGWGIGGLCGGILADYIGRKRTMIYAILAYSLLTG